VRPNPAAHNANHQLMVRGAGGPYKRPPGRRPLSFSSDHVAYWQILFQTVSCAAGFRVATGCAHSAGAMEVLLAVIV